MDVDYKAQENLESFEKLIDVPIDIDTPFQEMIDCIQNAIISIKNGENILESFQSISNELIKADHNNVSIEAIEKTGISNLILPYININQEYELLKIILSILNKLVMTDQPENSPFQDENFLLSLISLFQSDFLSIKIDIVQILVNLLHDQNISQNIFEALAHLNFLKEIENCEFFNTSFLMRRISADSKRDALSCSSEILSMFAQYYSIDVVVCMVQYIPFLSSSLQRKEYTYEMRSNYAEALAYILRNPETHSVAFESKVPENCVASLCKYHDPSMIKIWRCIYHLIEFHDDIPAFISPTFQGICTHLLESPHENNKELIAFHLPILEFLDLYLPKVFNQIEAENFFKILMDILLHEDQPYKLRIPACLILIKCIYSSNIEYVQYLIENGCMSFLFKNIASFENDNLTFILTTIRAVYEKYPDLQSFFLENEEFLQMLEGLDSDDNSNEAIVPFLEFFNPEK